MNDQPKYTTSVTTPLNAEKLKALIKQQCRAEFGVEILAHDPLQIPHMRIFELSFDAPEDRDRAVIALRMAISAASAKPMTVVSKQHERA